MNRYSENFEEILDLCLTDIQTGKRTIDECLAAYPEYQADLEVMLGLSMRLSAAKDLEASPDFRNRALAHFSSLTASTQQSNGSSYPTQPVPRTGERTSTRNSSPKPVIGRKTQRPYFSYSLAAFASIIVVFSLLSSSVAFAANQSSPGSAFYPIKIALEQVELQLSTTEAGDQQLHVKFAARRLAEVDLLLQENRSYLIDQAISNYADHLSTLIYLLNSPGITEQERLLIANQILDNPGFNEANLYALSQRIPPVQRADINAALETARDARRQAAMVFDTLPEIRDRIRQLLISTVAIPGSTATSQAIILGDLSSPTATATPTPMATHAAFPSDEWFQDLPEDIPNWYSNTPDWSKLATQFPAIYPTLAGLATQYPDIRSTPRPYLIPTRVRPSLLNPPRQAPTIWPTPPVIPTR